MNENDEAYIEYWLYEDEETCIVCGVESDRTVCDDCNEEAEES